MRKTKLTTSSFHFRNLKMVSESSEGRALPQNVNGRYDASEERHLARLVTKASLIQYILPLTCQKIF